MTLEQPAPEWREVIRPEVSAESTGLYIFFPYSRPEHYAVFDCVYKPPITEDGLHMTRPSLVIRHLYGAAIYITHDLGVWTTISPGASISSFFYLEPGRYYRLGTTTPALAPVQDRVASYHFTIHINQGKIELENLGNST